MRRTDKNSQRGLITLLIAILACANLLSQEITSRQPSRQEAFKAFSGGDYLKAYNEFTLLLETYPKDPLYKYYSGTCLVKMKKEPAKATSLLRDALSSSHEIITIPEDAWFYLGRSQQMAGQFNAALKSFDSFISEAGKKNSRKYNVSDYMKQCTEGKGMLADSDASLADVIGKREFSGSKEKPVMTDIQNPDGGKNDRGSLPAVQKSKEPLPEELDTLLSEGLRYQTISDSLKAEADGYKKDYPSVPDSSKSELTQKISKTGTLSEHYRKLADEKLTNTGSGKVAGSDTLLKKERGVSENQNVRMPSDTGTRGRLTGTDMERGKREMTQKTEPVFSVFELIKDPARIGTQIIEIDPVLTPGLVYRIQMGVFSKPVDPTVFKGISPVYGFRIKGSNMIRYFAGMFRRLDDANKALLEIKRLGFKDSFVVPLSDGVTVSLERASVMEKEWGSKPLFETAPTSSAVTRSDSAPLTLSYRIQLLRTDKPVKEDIEESYRRLAGSKSFEILSPEQGQFVYLIGNFITFESASEYADLLNRNGYRDAKVVAYLGSREIPIETAKQLFEKIE
jgi:tetratricopeptide (TPR) repeat protein